MSQLGVILLRFDAPLVSFGGVKVDQRNVTEAFPGQSMLTGLLANALGYHHRDAERLDRLQERIRYAVRRDRRGRELVDFQTVDLGQDFLHRGWTTRGAPAERAGGSAKKGTHIRDRHYWADAVFTVALTLDPAGEEPDLERCARALREPERPLFLGRKCCLPSLPIYLDATRAPTLREALARAPLSRRAEAEEGHFAAWWPRHGEPEPPEAEGRLLPVYDSRDWANQVHTGRRFVWAGRIAAEEVGDGG